MRFTPNKLSIAQWKALVRAVIAIRPSAPRVRKVREKKESAPIKCFRVEQPGKPLFMVAGYTRSEARAEAKKVLGIKKGRLPRTVLLREDRLEDQLAA